MPDPCITDEELIPIKSGVDKPIAEAAEMVDVIADYNRDSDPHLASLSLTDCSFKAVCHASR